jgi:hypothetical protein
VELKFKKWLESIFGQPVDEPEPASETPRKLNNGAFQRYDLEPLPGNKKPMKKQKKI